MTRYFWPVPPQPTPDDGHGSERMHLLQRWLDLEAECDRELARQFHEAQRGAIQPLPALWPDIDGLRAAADRAKVAYQVSKKERGRPCC